MKWGGGGYHLINFFFQIFFHLEYIYTQNPEGVLVPNKKGGGGHE